MIAGRITTDLDYLLSVLWALEGDLCHTIPWTCFAFGWMFFVFLSSPFPPPLGVLAPGQRRYDCGVSLCRLQTMTDLGYVWKGRIIQHG